MKHNEHHLNNLLRLVLTLFFIGAITCSCNQKKDTGSSSSSQKETTTKQIESKVKKEENISSYEHNTDPPKPDAATGVKDVQNTSPVLSIEKRAKQVLDLIAEKNYGELDKVIHPEKGIRFSPELYINPKTDISFNVGELGNAFHNTSKKYHWGNADGSGEPIMLSLKDYHDKYIFKNDFRQKDIQVSFNKPIGSGNSINNQKKIYPHAKIVEYHFKGSKKYEGMDWNSLYLIFEKHTDNHLYLVGIANGQWTI